jgi:hypothetical protein
MTIHVDARRIADTELARRRVARLPAAERSAVEELASSLAAAVADAIVDTAAREPALAAALASIYESELLPNTRLVRQPLELLL